MNDPIRRGLSVAAVGMLTAAASWWGWPHPALDLRIERGGRGVIVDRWGRTTALPETIHVSATGRNTRVRIENRDTAYQTLGIFGVAANSSRSFSVPLPGAYGGFCSAHPTSQQITYVFE